MSDVVVYPLEDLAVMRRFGVACGLEDSGRDDEDILAAWGAFDGERLIGTICLERQGKLAVPNWMAVEEGYRRRGIARRLYVALEDEARRRGVSRLWVTARNPAFFAANGFVSVDDPEVRELLLGGCLDCEQYGRECEPMALSKRLVGMDDPDP